MTTKPKDFFKRLPPQREKRPFLIGALDCETEGLDGELLLVTAFHESWKEPKCYKTMGEFLDDIIFLDETLLFKTIWYSHNAEYDWRYLLPYFKDYSDIYDIRPIERMRGKFFEIGVYHKNVLTKNGKPKLLTKFRDSFAIYNQSLKDFTKNFAPKFEKQDIGLDYQNFNVNDPSHIEYALNDVVGLVEAVKNFDRILWEKFSVHLKGTFASTAYQAMLRQIPPDEYHERQKGADEDFFRLCYYGGRVQLNCGCRTIYNDVTVFDINSSYPAAMRLGVPKGRATNTKVYREGLPGFYECFVKVPVYLQLPPIPRRGERYELSFPVGTFKTFISSLEIEYGKTLGIEFKVIRGLVFTEGLTNCFNDLVTICENMRKSYKKTATEIVVKYVQNSVYGKFGTKKEGREIIVSFDDAPEEGFLPVIDEETGSYIPHVYYRDSERDAEYMLPHYAAWITANARITLDRGMRSAGANTVLYADTDSLHVVGAGVDAIMKSGVVGASYGQYKLEKVLSEVRYHAPKSYTYRDAAGEIGATYKGIPAKLLKQPNSADPEREAKRAARDKLAQALHSGENVEVTYHSSQSLTSFLKSGVKFSIRKRRATLPENINSHRINSGQFEPIVLAEAAPLTLVERFKPIRIITTGVRRELRDF